MALHCVRSLARSQRPLAMTIQTRTYQRTFRTSRQNEPSKSWSTGRVLLLTSLTSLLAYGIGIADVRPSLVRPSLLSPTARISQDFPKYGNRRDLEEAIRELRVILGNDAVSTGDEDLRSHGFSEWSTSNVDRLPVAVVYPNSTEEVSQIAKTCSKYRVPMIPYSGGSSLEGNFSCPYGGVSIDFSLMDQIIALHDEDMDVVVQPAVQWMDLNAKIASSGLFFPVDPGPSAKIGGMVGTGCSGTNAVRYGTMRDWVVNLTVVLADGSVIKTRRRPRKSAAGYNLNNLFVGSEGTLGIVTEATLKLAVIPQETSVAVVTFPSMRDAANTAIRILRTGIPVAALEIMDEVQMNVVNRAGCTGRTWKEAPTLFIKFSGTKTSVQENVVMVKSMVEANSACEMQFARSKEEQRKLWSARKEALWSMLALRKEGDHVWSTDVAVPISRLPDLIEISKKEMDDLGLFAGILGHVGDGNFHEGIMYDDSKGSVERAAVEQVVHQMVERALEMDGTCTGEHGVGIGKKDFLVKEVGPNTIEVMQKIKDALDPQWLLNPGKIFNVVNRRA